MHTSGTGVLASPTRRVLPIIAGASVLHLLAVMAHVPLYETFFQYQSKPLGGALALGMIAAAAAGLILAVRSRLQGWRYLYALVALSLMLQHGLALTEGRGLEALRDRAVTTGHAEFARLAIALPDSLEMITGYETLLHQRQLGRFAPSKPPGTLLLYMVTERVAQAFGGSDRFTTLTWAMTWSWPLLAALAVVPLYYLALTLFGASEARLAAALLITAPSFNLVQLHTDQAFFPALFTLCLLLLAWAGRVQAAGGKVDGPALAAGASLYIAAFFQLPLVFAAPLIFALVAAERFTRDPLPLCRARLLEYAGMTAAGFGIAAALGWVLLNYNPAVRYLAAMGYHGSLKAAQAPATLPFGLFNLAEFFTWAGVPLVGLGIAGLTRAWRHWRCGLRRGPDGLLGLAAALGLVLIYFAFFARTISEVARLWLFLVPVLCLLAGRGAALLGWRAGGGAVGLLLGLQVLTAYVMKVNQDFD